MKISGVLKLLKRLDAYGTSEGVTKGWDTRGRSNHPEYQHGVHIGIWNRPEQANQHAHSVQKFFRNPPVKNAERERIMRAFANAYLVGKRKINLDDVVPMQKTIVQSHYNRWVEGLKTRTPEELANKLPTVFSYEGKHYVLDGHHRLSHEVMQGKDTAEAVVFAHGHTHGVA